MQLSDFERRVLRRCAGKFEPGLEQFPDLIVRATERLKALGLIYFTYDDDQPTYYATDLGEAMISDNRAHS